MRVDCSENVMIDNLNSNSIQSSTHYYSAPSQSIQFSWNRGSHVSITVGLEGKSLLPEYQNYHDTDDYGDEKKNKKKKPKSRERKGKFEADEDIYGDNRYVITDPTRQEDSKTFEYLTENLCRLNI